MSLVIGPLNGLGLEGIPWLDVGLVGVTSTFEAEHQRKTFMAGKTTIVDHQGGCLSLEENSFMKETLM